MRTAAVLAVFVFVVVLANFAAMASPIARLQNATYTQHIVLYQSTTTPPTYSVVQQPGYKPSVIVARNPNASGWDYLRFDALTDDDNYYAMGYAEGWVTFDAIYSAFVNEVLVFFDPLMLVPEGRQFLETHFQFWLDFNDATTPFGQQLMNQRRLLQGMAEGWMARYERENPANISSALNLTHIYMISYVTELETLANKFNLEARQLPPAMIQALRLAKKPSLHCSAFVKRTADDVFLAHDTWSVYNCMLRQLKTYRPTTDTFVTMSTYPGSISSIDDWYTTSHGLAVTETTNGLVSDTLFPKILPNAVSEFNRVMIANFVATTPKQWFTLFACNNSGTYNNQYMVLDANAATKAVAAKAELPAGTFYVGEQIPGLVEYQDLTDVLNSQGYWGSYNVPYFPVVYNLSGFAALNTPQSAGFFTFDNTTRARLFRELQANVTDVGGVFEVMRYNDWQSGDISGVIPWCQQSGGAYQCDTPRSAVLGIASRFDLAPSDSANLGPAELAGYVNQALMGAIDSKIASAVSIARGDFTAWAINGPTTQQQAPFDFDAFVAANPIYALVPRRGLPSFFDNDPIEFRPLT
jgi:hypothetical protein